MLHIELRDILYWVAVVAILGLTTVGINVIIS